MNAIVKAAAGGMLQSLSNLKTALNNVRSHIPNAGGDPLVRLGRDGVWVYGAENVEVQEGSRWAVNPLSIEHGWICWTDYTKDELKEKKQNVILNEVMVPASMPLPSVDSLSKQPYPYAQQVSVQLKCLTGDDRGTEVLYKPSSVGGSNAMSKLIGEIMAQMDADPEKPIPVIVFETDSYAHKTWGKTFVPVLDIVDWVPFTDDMPAEDTVEAAAETKPAPEPTRRRTGVAQPAAAEAPVAVDPKAARRAQLEAEMAALEAEEPSGAPEQPKPEANAPVRRRRRA